MPTLLLVNGFRFFFYSNENDEPIQVHVTKAEAAGKIWLEPEIMIAYLKGNFSYKSPALVYVDVNGVGYEVNISPKHLWPDPKPGFWYFIYFFTG